MKINVAEQEVLEGLVLANREMLSLSENMVISNALVDASRVAIVAMGASGTEPSICGFVGQGLADIAVIGNLEAAPGPAQVLKAVQAADRGQGVLLVVMNNSGDILTSNIVLKEAAKLGLKVARVIVHDEAIATDIDMTDQEAVAANNAQRQGLVGILPALKVAGAAAQAGFTLEQVAETAQVCVDNTATASFLQDAVTEELTAEAIAETLLPQIEGYLKLQPEEQLLLIVNGNETMSLREQLALYRSCYVYLMQRGFKVVAGKANNYFTGQDKVYAQVCVAKLTDQQLELWNQSCNTPYFKV